MFSHRLHRLIILISTLVIILAITVMSLNTLEMTSDVTVIKMLPADYNPYQRLYNEMLYTTVRIESVGGVGSGVIIHHKDAPTKVGTPLRSAEINKWTYILTAAHVVGNNTSVTVTIYSQNVITSLPASVVITDTYKDLALLATDPLRAGHGLTRTYSAKLAGKDYKPFLFTPIYTVGCSLGLDPRPSSGIITAIRDNLRSSASNWEISAPILPGNSGGPVYSADTHEVIGIAVWVKVYHGQLITTMAGIVPIQTVYQFLDEFYHKDTESTKSSLCPLCLCGEYCQSVVIVPGSDCKQCAMFTEPVQLIDIKENPDALRDRDLRASKSLTLQLALRGGE
jgi:S1-C subfamily serine protease